MVLFSGLRGRFAAIYILSIAQSFPSPVVAMESRRASLVEPSGASGLELARVRRDTSKTFEIPFEISWNFGDMYYFNCTIGEPAQIVNMSIRFTAGDSQISNITADDNPWRDASFDGSLSKSFKRDVLVANYNLSADYLSRNGSNPYNVTDLKVAYSSDDILINRATLDDMAFVYWSNTSYSELVYDGFESGDKYPYYWLGLGLAVGQSALWSDGRGRGTPYPTFGERLMSQDLITSNTYSIWLDTAEGNRAKSGHLLMGGINSKRYKGQLIDLPTSLTLTNDQWGLLTQNQLTVSLSSFTINGPETSEGDRQIKISERIEDLVLSHDPANLFPTPVARKIWDAVGAEYDPEADLTAILPTVPCSFLSNSSTLDLEFGGSPNFTLSVPMSYLTARNGTGPNADEGPYAAGCIFLVFAGVENKDYVLSVGAMRNLYTVYDLENNIISVALTDHEATEDHLISIPTGGIALIPDSAFTSSLQANSTSPASKAERSKGVAIGLGIGIPILLILSGVAAFFFWRTHRTRQELNSGAAKSDGGSFITETRPGSRGTAIGPFSAVTEMGGSSDGVELEVKPGELVGWPRMQQELGVTSSVHRRGDVLPIARNYETRHELP